MGAILAAIPALSGTTGTILTTAASVSSIIGGLSSIASGYEQQELAELQSRQTELQGRLDAIKTNEDLLQTLSRNKVAFATSGLKSAGSVEYAKQQSMANAAEQLNLNRLNVQTKKASLEYAGEQAKREGIFQGIGSSITAGDLLFKHFTEKKQTK